MKSLAIVRLAMIVGLLGFYLFWFIPSMRSLSAYEKARDRIFDQGSTCWSNKYHAGEYAASAHCYDEWNNWMSRNSQPDSRWDWPWATWKER